MEKLTIAALVMMAVLAVFNYFVSRSTERTRKQIDAEIDSASETIDKLQEVIQKQENLIKRMDEFVEELKHDLAVSHGKVEALENQLKQR